MLANPPGKELRRLPTTINWFCTINSIILLWHWLHLFNLDKNSTLYLTIQMIISCSCHRHWSCFFFALSKNKKALPYLLAPITKSTRPLCSERHSKFVLVPSICKMGDAVGQTSVTLHSIAFGHQGMQHSNLKLLST